MRLIDADAIEYEHIKGEFRVSEETINGMPTVCDIEQIRDEIEREADHYDAYVNADIAKGLYYAGEIMDKYINGGMSPEVKEHYEKLAEHYNAKVHRTNA